MIKPVCSSAGELWTSVCCCDRTEGAAGGRDRRNMQFEQLSSLELPGYLPGHFEEPPGSLQRSRTRSFWRRCRPGPAAGAARTACRWRSSASSGTGWWTREHNAQCQSLGGVYGKKTNKKCKSKISVKPSNPAMTLLNMYIPTFTFVHLSVPCSNEM